MARAKAPLQDRSLEHFADELAKVHRVVVARDGQRRRALLRHGARDRDAAAWAIACEVTDEQQRVIVLGVELPPVDVIPQEMNVADDSERLPRRPGPSYWNEAR